MRDRPTTVLLISGGQLESKGNRLWFRGVARVAAAAADRRLAAGRPPESSSWLAARAHLLVSPALRCSVARSWQTLLERAAAPPLPRDPRVPVHRPGLLACRAEIDELLTILATTQPISARGMAMACSLLRDGGGPLYRHTRPEDPGPAVRAVLTHLGPTDLAMPTVTPVID